MFEGVFEGLLGYHKEVYKNVKGMGFDLILVIKDKVYEHAKYKAGLKNLIKVFRAALSNHPEFIFKDLKVKIKITDIIIVNNKIN